MEPDRTAIEAQLETLLTAPDFVSAPKMRELLRYLVTATLNGEGDRLKGYSIGVDVFGRGESFDPATDAIVRVQIGRLRKLLTAYYKVDSPDRTVNIVVPKGSYAIEFQTIESADDNAGPTTARTMPRRWMGLKIAPTFSWVCAFVTLAIVAGAIGVVVHHFSKHHYEIASARPSGPVIYVAQYRALGDDQLSRRLRDGLQFELIDRLSRFRDLWVLGLDTVYGHQATETSTDYYGADFILSGSVQIDETSIRVTSQLSQGSNGAVVWSNVSNGTTENAADIFQIQSEIASEVAAFIGQPLGVVHQQMKAELDVTRGIAMGDYLCLVDFFAYSLEKSAEEHSKIRNCLEDITRRSPRYSAAWAALSWMYGDEERYGFNRKADSERPLMRARNAAEIAVESNPMSAMAHQYLAIALYSLGDDAGFRVAAERSLELNPNNSETLAGMGWSFIVLDNSMRGKALVEKAIELNPGHPPWYHGGLAIFALENDQPVDAIEHAAEYAKEGGTFANMLLVAAYRLNNETERAGVMLKQIGTDDPVVFNDRETLIESWRISPSIEKLIFGNEPPDTM